MQGDAFPCLELGCGAGLPSVVLASQGFGVVATDDEEEVVELVAENSRLNESLCPEHCLGYSNLSHRLCARRMDWSDETARLAILTEFPNGFALVFGADIVS